MVGWVGFSWVCLGGWLGMWLGLVGFGWVGGWVVGWVGFSWVWLGGWLGGWLGWV